MKITDGKMYDTEEEKIMALFTAVNGKLSKNFRTEIVYDEDCKLECVKVWKGDNLCWQVTKVDLLFDFVTMQPELLCVNKK